MAGRRDVAVYRTWFVRTWSTPGFRSLSPLPPSGQSLEIYLVIGEKTCSIPGLLRAGRAELAEALRWPLDEFDRAFDELVAGQRARHDRDNRVVLLPGVLEEGCRPQSPNVALNWGRVLSEFPPCELVWEAHRIIASALEGAGESFQQAFVKGYGQAFPQHITEDGGTTEDQPLLEALGNQEQEQKPEPTKEQRAAGAPRARESQQPQPRCTPDQVSKHIKASVYEALKLGGKYRHPNGEPHVAELTAEAKDVAAACGASWATGERIARLVDQVIEHDTKVRRKGIFSRVDASG